MVNFKFILAILGALTVLSAPKPAAANTGFEGAHCSPADTDPLKCMVCVINAEDNKTTTGMRAVGQHVMERVESGKYPRSVCGVVHQPGQYFPNKPLSSDPKKLAEIVAAARYAIANGGNGYLGFRSYCRPGKGDIRIGGNCFRKKAELPDSFGNGLATDIPRDVAIQAADEIFGPRPKTQPNAERLQTAEIVETSTSAR